MASGNISPRQKMINMMYLVLTAMLALNVSAEILKAFSMINNSLEATNGSIGQKNDGLYAAFEKKMQDEPGKTKVNYDKAMLVKKESKALLEYIQAIKNEMTDMGGNKDGKVSEEDYKIEQGIRSVTDDGNIDISSTLLVIPDGKSKKGMELMNKINEYRKKVESVIDPRDKKTVKLYLEEAKDPEKKSGEAAKNWLQSSFGEMPLMGAITLLTKFESDIRNTETEVVGYLLGAIDAQSFKFDQLVAKVISKSNYVLTGQQYEADIMLVAYDSRQDLEIEVGGTRIPVENGLGKYKVSASSEGVKKWAGVIKVKNPATGEVTPYEFTDEYTVARPAAVVSPDKMNVFYIGVDNPVSISAPGVTPANLAPTINGGGTIKGSNGKYTVNVSQPGKVMVTVNGKGPDGKNLVLGGMEFRVKYVPDPVATIGGLNPGQIGAAQFKAQGGMIALLKDFDFDLRFNIQSFRMIYIAPRQDPQVEVVTGPTYSPRAQQIIRNAKPGDRFIFDDIKALGPDKVTRKLNPVTYGLN
jgi:gliding motility-associated protein GldM